MAKKTNIPFRRFHVPIEIYNTGAYVIISRDLKRFVRWLNKKYNTEKYSEDRFLEMDACVVVEKGRWFTIYIESNEITPKKIAIISHECLHIVQEIMQSIHAPQDESTQEPCAYLLEFLVEKIVTKLMENKKST